MGSYQLGQAGQDNPDKDHTGSGGSGSGGSGSGSGSSGGAGSAGAPSPSQDAGADSPSAPVFRDCAPGAWCVERELMRGVGEDRFSPDGAVSRAQAAQAFYNRAGRPAVSVSGRFTDVPEDAWYYDAVTWAAGQGLLQGCGGGRFDPDAPVTREQTAVMFFRAAGEPAAAETLEGFDDGASASAWAEPALRWAVGAGLLHGRGEGRLAPGGTLTRAELAALLMRSGAAGAQEPS